jgi:hypothetical protein
MSVPLMMIGLLAFTGFFLLTLYPVTKPGRLLGPLAILARLTEWARKPPKAGVGRNSSTTIAIQTAIVASEIR